MAGVELIVGGWFASAVIGKLVDQGRSYLKDNYDLHTGTRKMLEKLVEAQLPQLKIAFEEAEKRHITSRGLMTWLDQLKNAAYEAEDVLDHFEAKMVCKSINGHGKFSEMASSSVKMVKTLIFSDNDFKKLKSVVEKLDKLCMRDFITNLLTIHSDEGKEHLDNHGRETSSTIDPGEAIFGRDREIESILDTILNIPCGDLYHQALDDPNLQQGEGDGSSSFPGRIFKTFLNWGIQTIKKVHAPEQRLTTITTTAEPHSISSRKLAVIPIVGFGGVGKTAIAKRIYHNERVKDHFSSESWIYVSKNCDAKKVMQKILRSFKGGTIDSSVSLDIVEKMLKETIINHRFLLILDDVSYMTEHIWSRIRSVLVYGMLGSVVVVTTQSRSIANTTGTLPEVTLDVLQQDSFWELFQYYAFGGCQLGDQPPLLLSEKVELKKIGEHIAEKLHGLPLAGKVIGTLLSKKLKSKFWKDTRESDWWNNEDACEKILSSIGAGYKYLDPELKQCFAFCSIFPKQYVFEREKLVQMWIAQGFIQPSEKETGRLDKREIRLEDIGRKWFGKLVDRSFFQPTKFDGKYIMPALVRDLAIAVSSNEFCFVKSNDKHIPSLARHLSIDSDNLGVELKCEDSTRLRTVILFGNWTNRSDKSFSNIFAKYNGLRVLDLSNIMIEKNASINAVCEPSHLRFVDLSFTGIKSIPGAFCALCHLQVLDVRGCKIEKLPKEMNQLINLRHLYASSDTISLISGIGKLTKLQELEEFRIGESKGHRISELMDMNEISGHLLLSNLNNVSSKEEASEAQLDQKKYLKSLELRFEKYDCGPGTKVKMDVLEALKPACSLEILKVGGCRWESFPDWVFSPHRDFCNLKVIHVYCFGISSLPAFGELASLEHLSFDDLRLIEKVGSEFYGSSDVVFPSLKELTFSKMCAWSDWSGAEAGKMIFPHLKKLHLENCSVLKELPTDCFTSSVVELILSHCHDLCNIETVLQGMPSLAHLSTAQVHNCGTQSLLRVGRLSSLRTLLIENSPAELYTRDEESWFNQLTSLDKLEFRNCSKLRGLPSQLHLLTSLKKLHIKFCPEMLSLPENGLPRNLAELHIDKCPHLISACQPHQGTDWFKISRIPFVYVK